MSKCKPSIDIGYIFNDDSKDRSLTEENFSNSWKYCLDNDITPCTLEQAAGNKEEVCNHNYESHSYMEGTHDFNNGKLDLNSDSLKLNHSSSLNDITREFYSVVGTNVNCDFNHNASNCKDVSQLLITNKVNTNGRTKGKSMKAAKKLNISDKVREELICNDGAPIYTKDKFSSHTFNYKGNITSSKYCIEKNERPFENCSKSMNDINKIPAFEEHSPSEDILFLERESVCSEALSLLSFPSLENLDRENSLNKSISTPSLKDTFSNRKVSKCKSLGSLAFNQKQDYSQVQSKVKKYIKRCKRQEHISSKSLPVTPVRDRRKIEDDEELLLLDNETLENLSLYSKKPFCQLPEDLEKIKEQIVNGTSALELVEELFEKLKNERLTRINEHITLNAMKSDYERLLLECAQARNTIDILRCYKEFHDRQKQSSPDEHTKTSQTRASNFKKAFSTSNICRASLSASKSSVNLARYPSLPVIDASCSAPLNIEDGSAASPYKRSTTKSSGLNFSLDTVYCDWLEKADYLQSKLKEYFLLECSEALKEEERDVIWNFILQKHSELIAKYESIPEEKVTEFGLSKMVEDINKAIQIACNKVPTLKHSTKRKDVDGKDASGFVDAYLPMNMPYSVINNYQNASDLSFVIAKSNVCGNNSRERGHAISLKQSFQKDADSGCPPSDRSTKNSHFPSFEHNESLPAGSGMGNENGHANSSNHKILYERIFSSSKNGQSQLKNVNNSLNISGINLRFDNAGPKKKNYTRKSLPDFFSTVHNEEDYDASASSGVDDSMDESYTNRICKRKISKWNKILSDQSLNRFEDKFIRQRVCNSAATSEKPRSSKTSYIDFSQMERNSKYLEHQVRNLRSKGFVRRKEKNRRTSLQNWPGIPWKAVANDSETPTRSSYVDNPALSNWVEDYGGENERMSSNVSDPSTNSFFENSLGNGVREDREISNNRSMNMEAIFSKNACLDKARRFSTSTPKSKDLNLHFKSRHIKENVSEFRKKSQSLSSLEIDPRTKIKPNVNSNLVSSRRSILSSPGRGHRGLVNVGRKLKISNVDEEAHMNLMGSLDAATSLAKNVRAKSQNLLAVFRTDLFPTPS